MLRRTKFSTKKDGRLILVLPPAEMKVIYYEQTTVEKDFYDAFFKKSKGCMHLNSEEVIPETMDSTMDEVIRLMIEVELEEKVAEEAKEEAIKSVELFDVDSGRISIRYCEY
nr:putative SWI/SNF-related matrix-associated actin-dependent regulator of chromatin subfamily A member 3-like 2 [Tanacetum cinerariifolium]